VVLSITAGPNFPVEAGLAQYHHSVWPYAPQVPRFAFLGTHTHTQLDMGSRGSNCAVGFRELRIALLDVPGTEWAGRIRHGASIESTLQTFQEASKKVSLYL
jgi:hypothetical protein